MNPRALSRLAGACFTLAAAPALAQTTWYVDVHHGGPGSGTALDPFTSIQAAIDDPGIVNGDVISVAPGVYPEDLDFSDSPGDLHVLSQAGPLEIVIAAPTPSSTSVTFSGWEVVEGFTLEGQGGSSRGAFVDFWRAGTLKGCIVRGYGVGCVNFYDVYLLSTNIVFNDVGVHHEGAGHAVFSVTIFQNSILWGNQTEATGSGLWEGTWSFEYSLAADPEFVSTTDLRLRGTSDAIDAGNPVYPLDVDGSTSDIGALPYDGNHPVGMTYCLANPNSSGSRGRIELSGTGRISANNLGLHAHGLPPNTVGLFFIGTQEVGAPLGNGLLCAGGHVGRIAVVFSDGSGSASHAFDNNATLGGAPPVLAGQTRTFQNWFRDVPAGGAENNLTNAVAVPFAP